MEALNQVKERRYLTLKKVKTAALTLFLGLLGAGMADAAQLRINPGDSAGNSLTLTGDFSFSVLQTQNGLDIAISGVKLVFNCEASTNPESCDIVVEASAAATQTSSTAPASNTGTVGSTTGGSDSSGSDSGSGGSDSGSNGSDICTGFGCNYGTGDGSGTAGAGDSSSSSGGLAGSGDIPVDTSGSTDSGSSECKSISCSGGLQPVTSSPGQTREPFPATNRTDYDGGTDFGSAGNSTGGETIEIKIGRDTVTVMPFTMKGGDHSGRLLFVPTSVGPLGSDAHFWISKEADGQPVSDGCVHVGNFDNSMTIGAGAGDGMCVLEPSGAYYLNLAACFAKAGDITCSDGAETGYDGGSIYMKSRY